MTPSTILIVILSLLLLAAVCILVRAEVKRIDLDSENHRLAEANESLRGHYLRLAESNHRQATDFLRIDTHGAVGVIARSGPVYLYIASFRYNPDDGEDRDFALSEADELIETIKHASK